MNIRCELRDVRDPGFAEAGGVFPWPTMVRPSSGTSSSLWVEKKIRRLLAKARQRQAFGWKRWSSRWLYERLGLFSEYKV